MIFRGSLQPLPFHDSVKYCLGECPFLYKKVKSWELEGHTGSSSETHTITAFNCTLPFSSLLMLFIAPTENQAPSLAPQGRGEWGKSWVGSGTHQSAVQRLKNEFEHVHSTLVPTWISGHKCSSVATLPRLIFLFPCNSQKNRKAFTEYLAVYWFGHLLGIVAKLSLACLVWIRDLSLHFHHPMLIP